MDRNQQSSALNPKLLQYLLLFSLLINAYGLLSPILGSNDAYFYSVIAKHIVLSGNWINLTFSGAPWLDKPHLPFWLTALSYKFFGINSFAYILPGFLFNLLGARYTYLLAKYLYSKPVGLLAAILYLTSLHLMLSAIDVRAEAYLMGEIMPACYYWLLYHQTTVVAIDNNRINTIARRTLSASYLLKGAFFTALAIMTKGIFVLIPIFSGLCMLFIKEKAWQNLISPKWISAILLTFIFIMPELIALSLQFDAHPELVVFNHTHVSGIKFFFWDSQFGRFFNTGPIVSSPTHTNKLGHYLFFIHTFLWAFLPWSLLFIVAVYKQYRSFNWRNCNINNTSGRHNWSYLYLTSSFFPMFIVFSVTKFQLDYYINILFPFACIICASYVTQSINIPSSAKICKIQTGLALLLPAVITVLVWYMCNGSICILIALLSLLCYWLFFSLKRKHPPIYDVAISCSVFAISVVFIAIMLINNTVYRKFDVGYNLSKYLNSHKQLVVVDYNVNSSSLEFHAHNNYIRINSPQILKSMIRPYYLVVQNDDWTTLQPQLTKHADIIKQLPWIPQEKFIPELLHSHGSQLPSKIILLILIK